MQKDLDDNSYEKRIENIEKGKSYLNSNVFFVLNQTFLKIYKDLFIKVKGKQSLLLTKKE